VRSEQEFLVDDLEYLTKWAQTLQVARQLDDLIAGRLRPKNS
jgi:hypothetical protein